MVNYCNKIFFVIFLVLCPLQPVYGVGNGGSIFPGSSLFKAIGAISSKVINDIKVPLICLYKKFFQGNNVNENLGTNLQVNHQSNKLIKYEKKSPGIPEAEKRVISIITCLYLWHKRDNNTNFFETLNTMRTKNENNNARIQNVLNEALSRARESGFLDEHCDEINNCLKQNIDVNFCDNVKGKNQLHIMLDILCRNSKKFDDKMFKNLLKRGVRLSPDKQGHTPLRAAMFIPHLKEQENKVDMHKYQTVLELLIDSVDLQHESNIRLIRERQEARGYLDSVIEINRPSNDIVAMTKAASASKGIIIAPNV